MKRLLLVVLACASLTACTLPAGEVHVEICPPYCGPANGHHGRPGPTTTTPCIGTGTDDDVHLVPCDDPTAIRP